MITALLASILNMHHLLPMLISQYGAWVYLGLFASFLLKQVWLFSLSCRATRSSF